MANPTLTALLGTALLLAPGWANGAEGVTDKALFQLGNECGGMRLAVERMSPDASNIGLTEKAIRNYAEGRLRGTGLFRPEWPDYLYIRTTVVGPAFSIEVQFAKPLVDPYVDAGKQFATTWDTGKTGTHGNNSEYIISSVREKVDEFLVEYLRVNDKACSIRRSQ